MRLAAQLTKIALIFQASFLCVADAADDEAAAPTTHLLWPDGAPGAMGEEEKDKPSLIVYLPETSNTATPAVVICPGGGYGGLAMSHEGHTVSRWLNSIGVAGVILKYRLPGKGYKHPVPLEDAQRAMRVVRRNATEWNIDPEKIGVMGFSAGGHLASTLGTHYDRGRPDARDPIGRESCRPDFMILGYAITTMEGDANRGSKRNLLGDHPEASVVKDLSNHLQVTSDTPPTFLVHADDDPTVLPEDSIRFYLALRKAGVPAEMHIYEKGGHGFGVGGRPRRKPSVPGKNLASSLHRLVEDAGDSRGTLRASGERERFLGSFISRE